MGNLLVNRNLLQVDCKISTLYLLVLINSNYHFVWLQNSFLLFFLLHIFKPFSEKNRCYEMSSFDEKQATTLLKERPIEFVNYNKHQLSRVYPAGTRFDSSNFNPQVSFPNCIFSVLFHQKNCCVLYNNNNNT